MDKELLKFLQTQKVLTLATIDSLKMPWISNVYYWTNSDGELFFTSHTESNHIKHISINENIAFSTVWYDPSDLENRKSIQGKGICHEVKDPIKLAKLCIGFNKAFPQWKDYLSVDAIVNALISEKAYMITPSYIKFFNDELYGEHGVMEFDF